MATATRNRKETKEMTPQAVTSKLKARKKVFDLDKFEKVTKEVEYEKPAPLKSMDDVLNLDEKVVLGIMNLGLARQAWKDARSSISGASPKLVNQFVNVFRMIPPHSEMIEKDLEGNPTKESRKRQTLAIYAWIKGQENILAGLKAAAANASSADEDEDEDEQDDN